MAFRHGKNTGVFYNGADLSPYFNEASVSNDVEVAETTAFGDNAKQYISGLRDGTLSAAGMFDGSEGAVDETLSSVIGNDAAITIAGQAGNFELNVMLPVAAHNLLESIKIISNVCRNLADKSVKAIIVNADRMRDQLDKNPILVTALNPIIGYDLAAQIAKKAYKEDRSLKDVALEMTNLSAEELDKALDPIVMTRGGFTE
jgi:fumarate hydratase class II